MLLIALFIKVLSPGPVFFRQKRIGLHGKPFTCLKFRTMHEGASTQGHEAYFKSLMQDASKPMTKLDESGDPRMIKGAVILRSMGLDELPQLINVLQGDMSWVGPRPCTLAEFESNKKSQICRFQTLPGLTGLWQVSGKNKTTFRQMVGMDMLYARTKSVWLDLVIMIRTPLVLVLQLTEVLVKRRKRNSKGKEVAAVPTSAEVTG